MPHFFRWASALLICCVKLSTSQDFNLYPDGLDPVKLSSALNITIDCLAALNQTIIGCDQTLFQMASNFDDYWWEDANITALCSGNCSQNAGSWSDALGDPCYQEYVTAYGKSIPASSVALRYTDGLNMVCLPSWAEEDTGHPWCLTESQEWIGSDIVRADCSINPSDPTCGGNASTISAANMRMANLYNDTILCDNCFIGLLWNRVSSVFLADSDHSDYLIGQLQDIENVCNTQLPEITIRNLPPYQIAPVTATATTSAPATTRTCAGQTVSSGSGCNSLSTTYGVSTGDLQALTGNATCLIKTAVCLPAACTLQTVASGQTCDTVATGLNITSVQFLSWNRNVMGLCDSLIAGQYVCGSAPGTNKTYTLPPPPLGTAASAGNQQRGGAGGVVTPTTTATSIGNSVSGGSAPSPTQDGLETSCNNYALVKSGDNCVDFAKSHNILPAQLYAWNPALGLSGADCSTKFWASEFYCIGATATVPVTAPGPAQTGITASCNKYAQAIADDTCSVLASRNSISNAQLFAWNGVLGTDGQNCQTSLWTGEWYCVGIASGALAVTTTSTTTKISSHMTAPGPTQTGISSNCITFAQAISGDSCDAFATKNHITNALLYAWNSVLGSTGQNCGTSLLAQEWYCVAVSGGSTSAAPTTTAKTTSATKTASTTATTTSHVTAPGPTQTGVSANCNKYAAAISGDSCDAFAKRNSITNANLYAWNTVLGTNGANCGTSLWAQEYYCIGISS